MNENTTKNPSESGDDNKGPEESEQKSVKTSWILMHKPFWASLVHEFTSILPYLLLSLIFPLMINAVYEGDISGTPLIVFGVLLLLSFIFQFVKDLSYLTRLIIIIVSSLSAGILGYMLAFIYNVGIQNPSTQVGVVLGLYFIFQVQVILGELLLFSDLRKLFYKLDYNKKNLGGSGFFLNRISQLSIILIILSISTITSDGSAFVRLFYTISILEVIGAFSYLHLYTYMDPEIVEEDLKARKLGKSGSKKPKMGGAEGDDSKSDGTENAGTYEDESNKDKSEKKGKNSKAELVNIFRWYLPNLIGFAVLFLMALSLLFTGDLSELVGNPSFFSTILFALALYLILKYSIGEDDALLYKISYTVSLLIVSGIFTYYYLKGAVILNDYTLFFTAFAAYSSMECLFKTVKGKLQEARRDTGAFRYIRFDSFGLFLVVFIAGFAGIFGPLINDAFDSAFELLWIGFLFPAISLIFTIISFKGSKYLKSGDETKEEGEVSGEKTPSLHIRPPALPEPQFNKILRALRVIAIILIIGLPVMTYELDLHTQTSVYIQFERTMYRVDGTPVTEIDIPARSAVILLYEPDPEASQNASTEYIRPGKTVRLGGYFYGLGDTNLSDAIEFFGNNFDVLSLGMCGSVFSPYNITQIKELNPLLKFYYMAFATTLYECPDVDPFNNENGTWGASHYPCVKFNDTMYDWTLKLKDGKEALGVRRKSDDSNAHLMDLGKTGWADYFAEIYSRRAELFHADGLAIDEVMWHGYWGVDVEDLRDYNSLDEIKQTCYDWLKRVHEKSSVEIITQAFWDEALQYEDGIWGEIAFRAGGQYGNRVDDTMQQVWYEENDWYGIVQNLKTLGEQNKTYIWAAWYERDDNEALEYSIATYLMGKVNHCTSVVFHPQPVYDGGYPANLAGYSISTVNEEITTKPEYFDLELGNALGDMYLYEGAGGFVYRRDFENGIVLVNPFHPAVPGF